MSVLNLELPKAAKTVKCRLYIVRRDKSVYRGLGLGSRVQKYQSTQSTQFTHDTSLPMTPVYP